MCVEMGLWMIDYMGEWLCVWMALWMIDYMVEKFV